MSATERHNQIFELVQRKQRVTVPYLAKKLFVSEMTVRRDLKKMENQGLIKRYHGGALMNNEYIQYPLNLRMHINEKEKRDLALRVTNYITDGQTIFLINSSTCAYIIPTLKQYRDLTVVTNSVQFVSMLAKLQVRSVLTGGVYRESEQSLVGRDAENFLRGINPDIAFLSCDGVTDDGVVTINDPANAEIAKITFRNAAKKIILVHNSKLGNKYTYTVCTKEEADDIIVF